MQLTAFYFGTQLNVIQQTLATQAISHSKWLHGEYQNYKSIDCWSNVKNLQAKVPTGLQFKLLGHSGNAADHSETIRVGVVGYKLELMFAHCAPENNTIGHIFNSGEQFCHSIWNHWHLSGIVNDAKGQRVFYDITEFLDRSQVKIYDVTANAFTSYWTTIQRDLNGNLVNLPITNYQMVTLQQLITIKSLGAPQVRQSPSSGSADIGDIALNQVWQTNKVAQGEMINQNGRSTDVWYGDPSGKGWVSGAWLNEVAAGIPADYQQIKTDLAAANNKLAGGLVQAKETVTALS